MEFKKLLDNSHNHLHHCNFLQNKVSKIRIIQFLNTLKGWVILATYSCNVFATMLHFKLKSIFACITSYKLTIKDKETILHFINPATNNTYIYMFKICPQRQNRCNLSQVPHVNSPEKNKEIYLTLWRVRKQSQKAGRVRNVNWHQWHLAQDWKYTNQRSEGARERETHTSGYYLPTVHNVC